jgi:hypothetical protein
MCDTRAKRIFDALWQGGACAVDGPSFIISHDRLGRTSLLQFFIVGPLSCFFEKSAADTLPPAQAMSRELSISSEERPLPLQLSAVPC